MADLFNIDEMSAGFKPLTVQFRGQEYVLGRDAVGLLLACELQGNLADEAGNVNSVQYIKALPQMLEALCPGFPSDDLHAGEQLALIRAVVEVVSRVGAISFQEEDAEGIR